MKKIIMGLSILVVLMGMALIITDNHEEEIAEVARIKHHVVVKDRFVLLELTQEEIDTVNEIMYGDIEY